MKKMVLLLFLIVLQFPFNSVIADNGDVLEQKIQLPKKKESVYNLLKRVSNSSGLLFIYDSNLIDNNKTVKIDKGEYTIREAIYNIIGNRDMQISVIDGYILITPPDRQLTQKNDSVSTVKQNTHFTFKGVLRDRLTNDPIEYGSIEVAGYSTGTITNEEGEFQLILPDSLIHSKIRFAHLGYESKEMDASLLINKHISISLNPRIIPLQEVIVRVVNPKDILNQMIENRDRNYASDPVNITAFYREGIKYKNKDIELTEAVLKIYKTGVFESPFSDKAKLLKMRQINDDKHIDMLDIKMKSGIQSCFQLDLVKNPIDFMDIEHENIYTYIYTNITVLNDKNVYVISFEQKPTVKEPYFRGELFIDAENHALVQAVFEIHPDYVKKASDLLIVKKSKKLDIAPQRIAYIVSYKPFGDTYYINHVRVDMHFKVKKKRQLFGSPLHLWIEMVNCLTETENIEKISRSDRIASHKIFANTKYEYDNSFWEHFNTVLQEDKLKESVLKMLKKKGATIE